MFLCFTNDESVRIDDTQTADIHRAEDKTRAATNEIARKTMIRNDNDNVILLYDI